MRLPPFPVHLSCRAASPEKALPTSASWQLATAVTREIALESAVLEESLAQDIQRVHAKARLAEAAPCWSASAPPAVSQPADSAGVPQRLAGPQAVLRRAVLPEDYMRTMLGRHSTLVRASSRETADCTLLPVMAGRGCTSCCDSAHCYWCKGHWVPHSNQQQFGHDQTVLRVAQGT